MLTIAQIKHLKRINSLPRTKKQKEASKKNVLKATLVSSKLPRTWKQIEASSDNGKLPKTSKQLKTSKINLCKGRLNKHKNYDKVQRKNGYVYVFLDKHKSGKRIVPEHQLIIEEYFGRLPKSPEFTHHLDEVKNNNWIRNIVVFKNRGVHRRYHLYGESIIKPGDIIFDGRTIKEEK